MHMKAHFRLAYEYNTFMAFSGLSSGQDTDIFICYLLFVGHAMPNESWAQASTALPLLWWWMIIIWSARCAVRCAITSSSSSASASDSGSAHPVNCWLLPLLALPICIQPQNSQLPTEISVSAVICDLRSASLEISEIAAIATRFATFWHAAAQMSKSWQRRTMNSSHCCFQLYGNRKMNEHKQKKKSHL